MITSYVSEFVRFCRGRTGARLLLVLSCAICFFALKPCVGTVDITADGETQTYITVRKDPQEIITQSGLAMNEQDSYRVVTNETDGAADIVVLRAFDVTVTDGGVPVTVQLCEGTVRDALDRAGVAAPDADDIMNVSLSEPVYAYMNITIDRVRYEDNSERVRVPFKTIKRETSSLLKGKTRVASAGSDGEKIIVTRAKYVNGAFVSSDVISEDIIRDAVNEVVEVGTADAPPTTQPTAAPTTTLAKQTTKPTSAKTVLSTKQGTTQANPGSGKFVDKDGREVAYSKVLTGSGTAYTAAPGSSTSTGRTVKEGLVAVDPKVIPYGTNLYIVSADGKYVYGYALAADTGGALRSGKVLVDLFYDTESQCKAFGRRDVIVYVLA